MREFPKWFSNVRIELNTPFEGWGHLIDTALRSAEEIAAKHPASGFRITKIGKKNGALEILVSGGKIPESAIKQIRDVMKATKRQSNFVCELCGSPGHLGAIESCLSVRCNSCCPPEWSRCVY